MTTQISKISNELMQKALMEEEQYARIQIGRVFFVLNYSSYYVQVLDITDGKDLPYKNDSDIIIHYKTASPSGFPEFYDEIKYDTIREFYRSYGKHTFVNSLPEVFVYLEQAKKIMAGDSLPQEFALNTLNEDAENTALVGKSSKQSLIAMEKDLTGKKAQLDLVFSLVKMEMEKKKNELENIRYGLEKVMKGFMTQIVKVQKMITTIELYLGIEEELVQLNEGEKAPQDTPISFRQLVLYIDEEVGIYEDGGLDFQDIETFDNWLLVDNNYQKLIPELKGMVVMHPRRFNKDYKKNPDGEKYNSWNRNDTYLLIRNGEILYRVFSEKLVMGSLLFPRRAEYQELLEALKKVNFDSEKEKLEDKVHSYKKQTVMLQGLIDRTEVFHPLPADRINLFDLDSANGKIQFIYDAEPALTEGRIRFHAWQREINQKVQRGSRILLAKTYESSEIKRRLFYFCNEYNIPASPKKGIYEVESKWKEDWFWVRESEYHNFWLPQSIERQSKINIRDTQKEKYPPLDNSSNIREDGIQISAEVEMLHILYNPKDEIYGGAFRSNYDPHERKKRIGLKIDKDDRMWLNYDQIDLSDVEYYLNSRVERPDYLDMMPVLKNIKRMRLAELEQEKLFVQFCVEELTRKKVKGDLEKMVWDAVDWWKYKNIWKRPIEKDDAKAFRMIIRHVLGKE